MCDTYTDPITVCHFNDLQEQEMKQYEFNENTKVLVVKQNGQIKAVGAICPHYGAPLHTGALGDGRVRCPWHGACFNLDTGDIEDFPGLDSLPCFKVDIGPKCEVQVRAKLRDLNKTKRLKNMVKRDPKNTSTFVVVGGGPSAGVCVETLRQEGFTGRIVMVCKETYLPYDRVKISKTADIKIETIQFRTAEFYQEWGIETMLGTQATKVDCADKTVALSNGYVIRYDKMFVATGSRASIPPIKGADLRNVCVMREYDDLKRITKLFSAESNVVCLGSSFIALEVAQSWIGKVKSMTVIARTEFPLIESFGPVIGERILRLFREQGVNMIMSSGINEVIGNDMQYVSSVMLNDGTRLPCNVLILGTGIKFNTDFLIGSGLPVNADGSIDADLYLRTLIEDVYVGGDIAYAPLYANPNKRSVIGHYQLAQYHGRIAAANMVGKNPKELHAVPVFFTMLFGKGFRYAGHGQYTDIVIEGDLENIKFVAYFINDQDRVSAVATCDCGSLVAQFAELQFQGKSLHRNEVQNQLEPTGWTKKLQKKC